MAFLFSLTKDTMCVKLRPTQMSVSTIGIVFNVEDVFLVGDDGSVATPDESGLFETYELDTETTYTVHGTPVDPKPNTSTKQAVTKWKPGCSSSVVPAQPPIHKKTTSKKVSMPLESSWTKAVEICSYEASMDTINKTCNLPIRLNETTANVLKVADIVAGEAFNGEPVVVLDCDNLKIPDTNGTRGSKFWRSTRKIKVITQADYSSFKGKNKLQPVVLSDSDSDFETPPVPKRTQTDVQAVLKKMDLMEKSLKDSMSQIDKIDDLKRKNSTLEIERATLEEDKKKVEKTLREFKNALSCIVCKSLAKFPWKVTPCCHIILCSDCGDRWLEVGSSCPHCRAYVQQEACENVSEVNSICSLIETGH